MFCSRCGTKAQDNAAFCSKCGAPLSNPNAPQHTYPTSPTPGAYVWVPLDALHSQNKPQLAARWAAEPQQERNLPVQTAQNKPKGKEQPIRDQIPDPTFSKFIDAPDPPLPFWYAKIGISAASILVSIWTLLVSIKMGTVRLLAAGAEGYIPGIYLIILIFLLVGGAICGFISKRSKGAAGCGALFHFFAAAFAFFEYFQDDIGNWLLAVAASCLAFFVVMLISAAGGISKFDLDD